MSDNRSYVANEELKKLAANCFYEKEYDKWFFSHSLDNCKTRDIFISGFLEGYKKDE